MPSKSKSQQRLFGMIRAMQDGKLSAKQYPKIAKLAKSINSADIRKYAGTKHRNLPENISKMLVSQVREALTEVDLDEADLSILQKKANKEKEQAVKAQLNADKEKLRRLKRGEQSI
jgi:hypothetical protein